LHLEQSARDGNRHVYAELDLAREVIRDLQDALKAKSELLGGEMARTKQLQDALADGETKREHQGKLISALEKKLTEESAEAARATRKRLEKKTSFIKDQHTYIHHLETTLRLFARLPAVQDYLHQLKEAKANGTLEVTRIGTAVLEADVIESKRPVEVES
jgi:vacuolar-type H+-ATPase subunit I/STV1